MGRLPDEQRAALLLVALEGMTIAEAATVLAIKTDTLASRLARARAALRSMTGRPGATGGPERRKPSLTDRGNIDAEAIARLRHGGPDGARELARLADDPAVRETLEEWDRQDAALQTLYGPVTEEPVPERLRMVIDGATPQKRFSASLSRLAAVLALLAIGGVAGWGTARVFAPGGEAPDLPEFALRAYETYAPEIVHPVEVSAAQHDHLTAWLSKRVGLKLSLPDLQAEGFRLMGGRIVPDEHGVAALLMYEDAGGKRMTLYVAAEPDAKETGFRYASNGGVDSVWWYGEGLGCAIVADLPRDRLKALGVAAYEQIVAL
jgi:anti-sigma factor RsiW